MKPFRLNLFGLVLWALRVPCLADSETGKLRPPTLGEALKGEQQP